MGYCKFILLYKLIVAYKSVDEALVCDHLNEWNLMSN